VVAGLDLHACFGVAAKKCAAAVVVWSATLITQLRYGVNSILHGLVVFEGRKRIVKDRVLRHYTYYGIEIVLYESYRTFNSKLSRSLDSLSFASE
jgi:hypothetical protein